MQLNKVSFTKSLASIKERSKNIPAMGWVWIVICIGVIGFVVVRPTSCKVHGTLYQTTTVFVNGKGHKVLVADTPTKWETGLMNVKSTKDICNTKGMVFEFPAKVPQVFWNKNTLVDLQIYWMADNTLIGESDLYSVTRYGSQIVSSPKPANRVVEILKSNN